MHIRDRRRYWNTSGTSEYFRVPTVLNDGTSLWYQRKVPTPLKILVYGAHVPGTEGTNTNNMRTI